MKGTIPDRDAQFGWVNVGTDADTGQFAVEPIRHWWNTIGSNVYPGVSRLLITTDAGGSNGSRLRLWKTEFAELATQTGLTIIVCHLVPGGRTRTPASRSTPGRHTGLHHPGRDTPEPTHLDIAGFLSAPERGLRHLTHWPATSDSSWLVCFGNAGARTKE